MADEIVYKKMTRKADKGLEGKVVAKHGKKTKTGSICQNCNRGHTSC